MLPPPGPHPGTPGPPHTGSALSPPPHLCLPPGPKLTLFTGSFHPWHEGHGRCVALASVPNLIIAPDHNPWKREIPPPFSVLRIIPLSGDTRLFVGFLGPKGPGRPTLSWVQTLVGLGFEVSLVLGDDCFDHIHRWHGAPTLLGLLSGLIIIPRLGGRETSRPSGNAS